MTTATKTRTRRHKTIAATANPNVFTARSNSQPGTVYTQTIDEAGTVQCDCPGFDRYGHCWHSDIARIVASRRPQPVAVDPNTCRRCGQRMGLYGCGTCRSDLY